MQRNNDCANSKQIKSRVNQMDLYKHVIYKLDFHEILCVKYLCVKKN
jgi:hypothetical protein